MKNILLITTLFCTIILTGCSADKAVKKADSSMLLPNIPTSFEREGEMVNFHTKIVVDSDGEVTQIFSGRAELQPIRYKDLKRLFFKSDKLTEYNDKVNDYFGDKYSSYNCISEDERTLSVGYNNATYSTPFCNYVDAALHMEEDAGDYNADKFSTSDEFQGFTREEAFQELKILLEKIGCEVSEEYLCYALDHETMSREEHWEDIEGNAEVEKMKESWEEEDDSYYFIINQQFHGLPVFHPYYYTEVSDTLSNSPVQAIISRRGIEMLSVERLFTFADDEPVVSLKSFSEIADIFEKSRSQILCEDPFVVTKAELKYFEELTGKDEYKVIPVWMISYKQEHDDTTWYYQSIYDAVSGEEIRP